MGHQSWRDRWNSGDPGTLYVLRYDKTTYKIGGTAASNAAGRCHHLNALGRYGITSWEVLGEQRIENIAQAEQYMLTKMKRWRHPRYSSREIFFTKQWLPFGTELAKHINGWREYQAFLKDLCAVATEERK